MQFAKLHDFYLNLPRTNSKKIVIISDQYIT